MVQTNAEEVKHNALRGVLKLPHRGEPVMDELKKVKKVLIFKYYITFHFLVDSASFI